jgi:death-on-curing protein
VTTFISTQQVLYIHRAALKQYGGSAGIRDIGLLESALARPQASFGGVDAYPDIYQKAAVLCHSLIKNHPFTDGNKRTGIICMGLFLNKNDIHLQIIPNELFDFALNVATDKLNEAQMANWLKDHTTSTH